MRVLRMRRSPYMGKEPKILSDPRVEEVHPSSGTGAGMVSFLNYAIKRNELVEASAVALRVGVNRVLETDETFAQTQVRDMDLDEVVRRFRNKSRGQFKDQSLTDYERRFRQTVEMYKKWLDNDPSWRPTPRKATSRRAKPESSSGQGSDGGAVTPIGQTTAVITDPSSQPMSAAGMVTYPYPVRPGLLAQIMLPEDLTAKEAERVAKFVASLAFEERLAIAAGPVQGDPSQL